MFEKEAEEYYESKPVHTYVDSLGFFHDLEGIKQAYIQGRIDERKANEWHNPKEILPKKDCEVLIEYDEHKTHRVVDWDNKSQRFGGFRIDEVTRWKEIE